MVLRLSRHLKDNQDDSIEDRKGVEGKSRNGEVAVRYTLDAELGRKLGSLT